MNGEWCRAMRFSGGEVRKDAKNEQCLKEKDAFNLIYRSILSEFLQKVR